MTYCNHPAYGDGHCAEMDCWNYASKCPRHAISGRDGATCSHDRQRCLDCGRDLTGLTSHRHGFNGVERVR